MKNPYYDKFLEIGGADRFSFDRIQQMISHAVGRDTLVREYSWSVPTEEAINMIAKYSPIIEVGAGTGYWASLITAAGGKVDCYDLHPPGISDNSYRHEIQHHPILPVSWLKWENTTSKSLLLSWPPYDSPMGLDTLRKYRGDTLIYIGEGQYGCCAGDNFFEELDEKWIEVEGCNLPQWDGIHDHLTIYRRK